jgi:hypothetical protein
VRALCGRADSRTHRWKERLLREVSDGPDGWLGINIKREAVCSLWDMKDIRRSLSTELH